MRPNKPQSKSQQDELSKLFAYTKRHMGYDLLSYDIYLEELKDKIQSYIDKAVIEAQLDILCGFRRRDFVLPAMYEAAILDRIEQLKREQ